MCFFSGFMWTMKNFSYLIFILVKVFRSFHRVCGIWNAICGAHIWFISFFYLSLSILLSLPIFPFSRKKINPKYQPHWTTSILSGRKDVRGCGRELFELFPSWKFVNYKKVRKNARQHCLDFFILFFFFLASFLSLLFFTLSFNSVLRDVEQKRNEKKVSVICWRAP